MKDDDFQTRLRGRFVSLLRWEDLETFWNTLRQQAGAGWYIYAVGDTVPREPVSDETLLEFINEMDSLLRREHKEEYCGIVYTDKLDQPSLVKIYDPNNLGVTCGFSTNPPPPGWILSQQPPDEVIRGGPLPGNRKRWWQAFWL